MDSLVFTILGRNAVTFGHSYHRSYLQVGGLCINHDLQTRLNEGVRLVLRRRTQGSLSQSPQGNWRWTRKVKAKNVTVALSDQQVELFRRGIDDHRKLENSSTRSEVCTPQLCLRTRTYKKPKCALSSRDSPQKYLDEMQHALGFF